VSTESGATTPARQPAGPESAVLAPPRGSSIAPAYDDGWLLTEGHVEPYLSFSQASAVVNWSDELEGLHEESSRTHFIDRWTRAAIVERVGSLALGAVVLDIGCSSGYLLEDLRAAYPRATLFGVDLIAAGLLKAHLAVPTARLLQADACALPLADGSIDAVASANLLEHIADDVRALREVERVLRPGARGVLVVPAGPGTYDYYDRFLGHERRYGRGELAAKCRRAGLEVVEDLHIASLLYPAFWLVKERNRRRAGELRGHALQERVAADIASTQRSRAGEVAWRFEDRLVRAGIRLPFGIRSLVVVQKPEVAR